MIYHDSWMKLALKEAAKGLGNTHPNPSVGAVIVRHDVVIGQGFTQPCGGDHAEVQAIKSVQGSLDGACLYVTLEPCAAVGRTPACTTVIQASGITAVIFASSDPNPRMSGGGKVLEQAGIKVVSGVCQAEADALNRPFFHYIRTGLPWVIAKAAISLDGKLATYTKHSQWISGKESRQHAHALRASCDAIIVGVGTLLCDNPSLTVRDARLVGKPPLRVVMGQCAPKLLSDCKLLSNEEKSRFYILEETAEAEVWRNMGMEVVVCESLAACFKHLADSGFLQVLLEGGGKLHAACFEAEISNEIVLYQAPILVGGIDAVSFWHGKGVARMGDSLQVKHMQRLALGPDVMMRGDVIYAA